jgi:hypothetical protein
MARKTNGKGVQRGCPLRLFSGSWRDFSALAYALAPTGLKKRAYGVLLDFSAIGHPSRFLSGRQVKGETWGLRRSGTENRLKPSRCKETLAEAICLGGGRALPRAKALRSTQPQASLKSKCSRCHLSCPLKPVFRSTAPQIPSPTALASVDLSQALAGGQVKQSVIPKALQKLAQSMSFELYVAQLSVVFLASQNALDERPEQDAFAGFTSAVTSGPFSCFRRLKLPDSLPGFLCSVLVFGVVSENGI